MRYHQSGRRKEQNPDFESKRSADGRSRKVNGPKRNDVAGTEELRRAKRCTRHCINTEPRARIS